MFYCIDLLFCSFRDEILSILTNTLKSVEDHISTTVNLWTAFHVLPHYAAANKVMSDSSMSTQHFVAAHRRPVIIEMCNDNYNNI